jgi:hypothetical protein
MQDTDSVPRRMQPIFDEVVRLTDEACATRLNQEYATLARTMAAALCRKRPSPLEHGRLETWACGIVYALGSLNFLFDKTQTPHLSAGELAGLFGLSKSTAGAKARLIMGSLKIGQFDWRWCLPSKLADNPLAWLIEFDGFIVDARHASRDVQQEALRRGLIPYLP